MNGIKIEIEFGDNLTSIMKEIIQGLESGAYSLDGLLDGFHINIKEIVKDVYRYKIEKERHRNRGAAKK